MKKIYSLLLGSLVIATTSFAATTTTTPTSAIDAQIQSMKLKYSSYLNTLNKLKASLVTAETTYKQCVTKANTLSTVKTIKVSTTSATLISPKDRELTYCNNTYETSKKGLTAEITGINLNIAAIQKELVALEARKQQIAAQELQLKNLNACISEANNVMKVAITACQTKYPQVVTTQSTTTTK